MRTLTLSGRYDKSRSNALSTWARSCRRFAGAVLIGVAVVAVWADPSAAESDLPFVLSGAQSGTVTAVRGNSVDVNGRSYQLAPDVVIVDPEGQPMEPADICPRAEVKFQVRREQPDRITKMVLYLPQ